MKTPYDAHRLVVLKAVLKSFMIYARNSNLSLQFESLKVVVSAKYVLA